MPDEQHDQRTDDGADQSRTLIRLVMPDRLADQERAISTALDFLLRGF